MVIEAESASKILSIKQKIAKEWTKAEPKRISLYVFETAELLEDHRTIADYGLQNNQELRCEMFYKASHINNKKNNNNHNSSQEKELRQEIQALIVMNTGLEEQVLKLRREVNDISNKSSSNDSSQTQKSEADRSQQTILRQLFGELDNKAKEVEQLTLDKQQLQTKYDEVQKENETLLAINTNNNANDSTLVAENKAQKEKMVAQESTICELRRQTLDLQQIMSQFQGQLAQYQNQSQNVNGNENENANSINAAKKPLLQPQSSKKNTIEKHICCEQFEDWLLNVVRLPQYLMNFTNNESNDIRYLEFVDESELQQTMKMSNKMHRKLFLKKAQIVIDLQVEFAQWLNMAMNRRLKEYQSEMDRHGILNLKDLRQKLRSKQDISRVLNIDINDAVLLQSIFAIIQADSRHRSSGSNNNNNNNNNNNVDNDNNNASVSQEGFNSQRTAFH